MDHSKKTTYLFSIDALRVIAILAVIAIHITTKTLATSNLNVNSSQFSFFINQTARFAVPLFFLISGFVLELNNKSGLSYVNFFKKRASKIVIPFVFWSIIYFILAPEYGIYKLFSLYFLTVLIQGMAAYHLYFIPTLILFYLVFPLFHSLMRFLKNPFILISIILTQTYFLTVDYYVKTIKIQYDLRIALLSFSMFIIGMVASHHKDIIYSFCKKYFYFLLALLLLLLPAVYFHSRNLILLTHNSKYMYSQYHPLNYFYTLIFTAVLYVTLEKTQFARKIFVAFSKLSFFVFFVHVLIQYILWDNVVAFFIKIYGKQILTNTWVDPLLFSLIACTSFTVAYIVHKIPNVYKITG